jgi:hypothetical protein
MVKTKCQSFREGGGMGVGVKLISGIAYSNKKIFKYRKLYSSQIGHLTM